MQQFVQALKINPALKLDPSVASPELQEVFDAAVKQVGGGATPKPPEDDDTDVPPRPPNDNVKGLQHNPVDEARPGEPLTVKAQVGSDVGAKSVVVQYRPSGQADFVTVPMKQSGADWVAVIPGDAIGDHALQYYIEARDKKGKALVSAGSASNPYIITMAEAAPGTRIAHHEPPKKPEDKDHFHRLFIFVMPGFGFGYAPSGTKSEVAYQLKGTPPNATFQQAAVGQCPPCGVVAPFHIGVELGGMITRHFSLSLLGRFEVYTGANAQTSGTVPALGGAYSPGGYSGGTTKAGGAVAGFLRARYRFLEGKIHPYVTASIGGGEIRDMLNLGKAEGAGTDLVDATTAQAYNAAQAKGQTITSLQVVCKPPVAGQATPKCVDSLKLGDFFVGGGGGVWWDVQKYVALILDINILGGIGVGSGGQSGLDIDAQLGVGVHFL
jgi:hypothetical protein